MNKGAAPVNMAFYLIIAAMLLIFIIGGFWAGQNSSDSQNYVANNVFLSTNLGVLGDTENTFTDTYLGRFSIGAPKANQTLATVESYGIKNGFIGHHEWAYEFNANNPQAAYLNFDVSETNLYGNLIVELNGKKELNIKVLDSVSPSLKLENIRAGANKLVIKAQGSGLRFWAPTIYKLKNIKFTLNDYGYHKFTTTFQIYDYELNGFDRAELSFFVTKSQREEPITIRINNQIIYDQKPYLRATPYTIIFSANETNLKLGENILEITTGENSIYDLENSLLKVFYFGVPNQTSVKRVFQVTNAQYKKISKDNYQGLIQFDNKVYLRGSLEIRLQNETTNHTFNLFPSSGLSRVFFDKQHISRGLNEIVLTTDGSMEISDLEVMLVEKQR